MFGIPGLMAGEPLTVVPTFRVFWEAWNLVNAHYVERSAIDQTRMTYGAIEGMLDSLGDFGHTRFLSPQALRDEREAISGRLEGIGAELVLREQGPTILAPLPNSPAERAGLKAGDTIVRVDGQEILGLSLEEVVRRIRGRAGTSVSLTVIHQGATVLTDVTIQREQFTVPSVTWTMAPGTSIAHVLVSQFAEHTGDQLVQALNDARASGASGLVFDLRNNTGGLRDEAVAVASQFVGDGDVLIEQDAQGTRTPVPARTGGVALDLPMVALINEGTASSAEIVAGALQDHQRAKLVGSTTVGTGTVLSTFNLTDGSAILLGTREWFTPDGHQIWHHGITPDVPVPLPASVAPLNPNQESAMSPEALQASQDDQLLRALEILGSP